MADISTDQRHLAVEKSQPAPEPRHPVGRSLGDEGVARSPEAIPARPSAFQERNMDAALATCDLAKQVHGALSRSPYVSPRELSVKADRGVVRLEGAVRSFFQKQMAQEVIRRVDGVERIENCLQVNW
jgi:osmotically-inducible protein OsmY